jgi:hypothetical protein
VRFKPLLPDITEILIDDHGGLAGLRQKDVELTGTSAMLVSFGGEGSNLYGEPLLENVREAWNEWRKANEVAARYDRKIAGAYLLLHYPSFGQPRLSRDQITRCHGRLRQTSPTCGQRVCLEGRGFVPGIDPVPRATARYVSRHRHVGSRPPGRRRGRSPWIALGGSCPTAPARWSS